MAASSREAELSVELVLHNESSDTVTSEHISYAKERDPFLMVVLENPAYINKKRDLHACHPAHADGFLRRLLDADTFKDLHKPLMTYLQATKTPAARALCQQLLPERIDAFIAEGLVIFWGKRFYQRMRSFLEEEVQIGFHQKLSRQNILWADFKASGDEKTARAEISKEHFLRNFPNAFNQSLLDSYMKRVLLPVSSAPEKVKCFARDCSLLSSMSLIPSSLLALIPDGMKDEEVFHRFVRKHCSREIGSETAETSILYREYLGISLEKEQQEQLLREAGMQHAREKRATTIDKNTLMNDICLAQRIVCKFKSDEACKIQTKLLWISTRLMNAAEKSDVEQFAGKAFSLIQVIMRILQDEVTAECGRVITALQQLISQINESVPSRAYEEAIQSIVRIQYDPIFPSPGLSVAEQGSEIMSRIRKVSTILTTLSNNLPQDSAQIDAINRKIHQWCHETAPAVCATEKSVEIEEKSRSEGDFAERLASTEGQVPALDVQLRPDCKWWFLPVPPRLRRPGGNSDSELGIELMSVEKTSRRPSK